MLSEDEMMIPAPDLLLVEIETVVRFGWRTWCRVLLTRRLCLRIRAEIDTDGQTCRIIGGSVSPGGAQ